MQVRSPYPPLGPFPASNTIGYSVAIAILLKSRGRGRYANYQQFESIRKLRASYTKMSQVDKQDRVLSLDLMHALMRLLEFEWNSTEDIRSKKLLASIGAYALIAVCGSFQGPEVFLVDLYGLKKYV